MAENDNLTSRRKKDHIKISLTDEANYKIKTNGFDKYEFEHYAITEVEYNKIDLSTKFFSHKINYPFIISCMTGGTKEAENINKKLAIVASELNIPIGVGSLRQALENSKQHSSYKIIRKNAKDIPILGNVGAAQIVKLKNPVDSIKFLMKLVDANAFVIHVNPLQELLQPEGEPHFKGLLKSIKKLTREIKIPFIVKEVGAGISKKTAERLLEAGIMGIDVAGSGGTSWAAIELLRANKNDEMFFREWGLPTSFCVRKTAELKKRKRFLLIASGGISNGIEIAKSIALGADMAASAKTVLQKLFEENVDGVIKLLYQWFDDLKKIMYLTGCSNISELQKQKLIRKEELY
ncbi:type 2 isopentenyl-diphosphate Delta-isomerase [Melioribacteraceae bacterium 4301-Me]|uniref:type 2 isopentenyl-diphosphate Delta-isomerase n=1 Tax=Pyranulibacter aquaticus TaxID=3163344 RepID=UPI00359A7219